jgi:phosphatidylcholine synthase
MASKAAAWSVHLFTASGAVLAVFALWEIGRGGFARAAIYLLAALAIDAVDGTLARRVGVAEQLPRIDGRALDDVVDYLNYAIVPVVFMLALGAFVHWSIAALPVLASAYGFAQVDAKTEDDFFLGWPSYWNVVALYVWLLDLAPGTASAWVALFSALVFVPLKYIYPSKLRRWRAFSVASGTLWVIAMAFLAAAPPGDARDRATWISLLYPAYYVALSAWLGGWWSRGKQP